MVEITISREEIQDLIADKFYEEDITEEQSQAALKDLELGDFTASVETDGQNQYIEVYFEFAKVGVTTYFYPDSVEVVD